MRGRECTRGIMTAGRKRRGEREVDGTRRVIRANGAEGEERVAPVSI